MDIPNSRLFIGCRSKVLAVMDANSGKVITTVPIGDRVDAVAFDADNSGRWLMHCHNLYHMLAGMITEVAYA